jgi:hypothetical protein
MEFGAIFVFLPFQFEMGCWPFQFLCSCWNGWQPAHLAVGFHPSAASSLPNRLFVHPAALNSRQFLLHLPSLTSVVAANATAEARSIPERAVESSSCHVHYLLH